MARQTFQAIPIPLLLWLQASIFSLLLAWSGVSHAKDSGLSANNAPDRGFTFLRARVENVAVRIDQESLIPVWTLVSESGNSLKSIKPCPAEASRTVLEEHVGQQFRWIISGSTENLAEIQSWLEDREKFTGSNLTNREFLRTILMAADRGFFILSGNAFGAQITHEIIIDSNPCLRLYRDSYTAEQIIKGPLWRWPLYLPRLPDKGYHESLRIIRNLMSGVVHESVHLLQIKPFAAQTANQRFTLEQAQGIAERKRQVGVNHLEVPAMLISDCFLQALLPARLTDPREPMRRWWTEGGRLEDYYDPAFAKQNTVRYTLAQPLFVDPIPGARGTSLDIESARFARCAAAFRQLEFQEVEDLKVTAEDRVTARSALAAMWALRAPPLRLAK
ncbi:MAG: hypothetical protein JNJ71_12695 [Rubrivivax sp.]|nr:hypothetical protein [Rubrivivax sp.]